MKWPTLFTKSNPVGLAYMDGGQPNWAQWSDPRKFITEGFQYNPIVYRCVMEIARAISDLHFEVHQKQRSGDTKVLTDHPALALLDNPNPKQTGSDFLTEAFVYRVLLGEMAIAGAPMDARIPAELWNINPREIEVKPGPGGMPREYIHDRNGHKTRFEVDRVTGRSALFFAKSPNPADYWRGQSPLQAAALAADTYNAGARWNLSLLNKSARPSGYVRFEGNPEPGVVQRLKEWFMRDHQGADNAGSVPVLHGGATFVADSTSPKDMDFLNAQKEAAKAIASAFGVPLPLIENDASTFNNMAMAQERFYTDTIIPIARGFLRAFGSWLLPAYGDGLRFEIDMDQIGALEGVRARAYERAIKAKMAGVLTADEAREAIGYGELTPEQRQELDPVGVAISREMNDDEARAAAGLTYGAAPH